MTLRPGRAALAAAAAAAVTASPVLLAPAASAAEDPPGAPGAPATWTTGDKDGVGTSLTRTSKTWFTLTDGTLSEVYYPAADTPNTRELQFAVAVGGDLQRETDGDVVRTVALADRTSLTYRQTSADAGGRWRLVKTYVTDPARSTVLVDVDVTNTSGGPLRLFTLFDPSLAGTSAHDTGTTDGGALVAGDTHLADRPVASALAPSLPFTRTSTGYVGTSDGWTDLQDDGQLSAYAQAGPGNIAQAGEMTLPAGRTSLSLALGFGGDTAEARATATASLATGFDAAAARYQRQWRAYLSSLDEAPDFLSGDLLTQYNVALMTVRAHEDKTYPGAFIASLTLPWGQVVNATGQGGGGGGYHFVWARDMYHQVSSLLAAGDEAAARRAVTWLFTRQQLPDGHFPQNSHPDGSPDQNNVQLDETAFPILLAWQTGRTGPAFYRNHLRKAADYLVAAGPRTPQERWETEDGYSPSTLASQIAALTAAADIARRNGDRAKAAIYQGTADSWQRQTEQWMYTTTGPVGDGKYYIRIEGDGDPNDGDTREYSDGAGVHPERNVLDAGFLELVRLGVKAPDDRYVAGSLRETDASIGQDTPSGRMWHRYTYDGYGEDEQGDPWSFPDNADGVGRLWPLLTGERGEYELANGRSAVRRLRTMHNSANDGYMIPEQVWDSPDPTPYGYVFGKGTGSAAPLAWAMAQYVRLAQGIEAGRPVETPSVVAKRYARGKRLLPPSLEVTSPADRQISGTTRVRVTGTTDGTRVFLSVNGEAKQVRTRPAGHGQRRFAVDVDLPDIRNQIVVVAVGPGGGTNAVTRTVIAYGDHVGGLTDPAGDDNGPGTYVYPTNGVFAPGTFDVTATDVYTRGDDAVFVTTIAGDVTNPFGGEAISLQRVNIYLGSVSAATPAPALPGTNLDTATAWTAAVVQDGRFDTAGVYAPGGTKTADAAMLAVPETRQIVTTVPLSALGGVALDSARYGVAMLGNAEAGEGIGYVRPVYDLAFWEAADPPWVKEWRFGGGAGVLTFDLPSRDTDTRDPNAIDIVVGSGQSQASVMDWRASSPVRLPMVPLAAG